MTQRGKISAIGGSDGSDPGRLFLVYLYNFMPSTI